MTTQPLPADAASRVAIFDLDYTLLDCDSEARWSQFLFEQQLVGAEFVAQIDAYYEDYEQGRLDMYAYEEFLLHPLTQHPLEMLYRLRADYLQIIQRLVRPVMQARVAWHRAQGHTPLLITASNSFIAEPIAQLLDFSHLICTQAAREGERYTGKLTGIPAFREGKLRRLEQWLTAQRLSLDESWGYSDSHNDLPLLQQVTHPVAVTPDAQLRAYAEQHHWEVIRLS